MQIDAKLKTALDESRLLILGAQVLFGFQFEAVFQELFANVPTASRYVHCGGLVMLLASIGLLIAPSLFHQIIFDGESTPGALSMATSLTGASLLPLTLGLGAATFVTFEQLFSRGIGIAAGAAFTAIALALLYGLGFALRRERKQSMPDNQTGTPLRSKIEQMLIEARVIIPPSAARLPADRGSDEVVQRTASRLQIYPRRGAVRGSTVGRSPDDAGGAASHRLSGRGRPHFL
jgi:Family of unknown function (DUF6328)